MSVAETILSQLGGNKFRVMTGASSFSGGANSLTFRIPGGGFTKKGIRAVVITLNPSHLYDVKFFTMAGARNCKASYTFEDVGVENLRDVFTEATGLAVSL